jgi:integrase
MTKTVRRLTALQISRQLPPGMHADGAGLYLQVSESGAKSWIYRFSIGGKGREMGLGSLLAVSLADARNKAAACRALRQDGIDPIQNRYAQRAQAALTTAKATTFQEAAERYIEAHRAGWKNPRHEIHWRNTLATHAYPVIGEISVAAIDTGLVLEVLEPIWAKKPETAGRVRNRMELILDWARSRGLRDGENPARWRGHLRFQLPPQSKVRRVEHFAALDYHELPTFMAEMRTHDSIGAIALEFTILTAARTSETLGATHDEIDLAQKLWTVSAARMKMAKEHRVPLSDRALGVLHKVPVVVGSKLVFPGLGGGGALSPRAMAVFLHGVMGRRGITVHGFRSTFRDWAAERTNYPAEVVEMALAHAVGNKVEAAYRRGDLFEKRRRLMADWATFCNTPASAVRGAIVPLRRV